MTQKPSKPIEARAIGLGLTKPLIDRLRANGIVLVDAEKLERLRAMVHEPVPTPAPAPTPEPASLGVSEAAQFLGIKIKALKGHAAAGRIGHREPRGTQMIYRFSEAELIAFRERGL